MSAGTPGGGGQATATVLERILAQTREELARRRSARPQDQLAPLAGAGGGRFREALAAPGIGVIAEFKRRSPSAGSLHDAPELEAIVSAYARGGAAAVSILTEGPNFGGALEDLASARRASSLPLLRKDFVLDAYQLHEALAAGADAVLLIVAALGDPELAALLAATREVGLDALVEAHDEAEVARAVAAGASIVGINNRDLKTFTVDRGLAARMRPRVPPDRVIVAESGIRDAADVARLRAAGVDAILVGETLMRAPDPAAALRALIA